MIELQWSLVLICVHYSSFSSPVFKFLIFFCRCHRDFIAWSWSDLPSCLPRLPDFLQIQPCEGQFLSLPLSSYVKYTQFSHYMIFIFSLLQTIKTNVIGTLNMLGLAKRVGARLDWTCSDLFLFSVCFFWTRWFIPCNASLGFYWHRHPRFMVIHSCTPRLKTTGATSTL